MRLHVRNVPFESAAEDHEVAAGRDAGGGGGRSHRGGENPLARHRRIIRQGPAGQGNGGGPAVPQFDPRRTFPIHIQQGIAVIGPAGVIDHELIDMDGGLCRQGGTAEQDSSEERTERGHRKGRKGRTAKIQEGNPWGQSPSGPLSVIPRRGYARTPLTTSPWTSVRRNWRP